MIFREYDTVRLRSDLPSGGVAVGAQGTVLIVHADGEAYEVEFTDRDGASLGVLTVNAESLEPDVRD